MATVKGLKEYKYYLIGTITPENKQDIKKLTRKIDRQIREAYEVQNGEK